MRRLRVDVHPCGDFETHESGGDDRRSKLRFLQSTGNSALPQGDVAFCVLVDWSLHQNVADLKTTARFEHARHFLKRSKLVRKQVEHAIRDNDVSPPIGHGQRLGKALVKADVREFALGRTFPGARQHGESHVDANDTAGGSDHACRDQAIDARTAPDVDDRLSGVEHAKRKGIASTGEGCDRLFGNSFEPLFLVAKDAGEAPARLEVKSLARTRGDLCVFGANGVAQLADVEPLDRSTYSRNGVFGWTHVLLWTYPMLAYSIDYWNMLSSVPFPRVQNGAMAGHRELKDMLYAQFARIGHALSSPKRIELIDLLSQGEKTVEQVARFSATPIKNTSAHLRVLRQARLVDTRRDGTYVYYRLADDDVFRLLKSLEALGHSRLADVQQVVRLYLDGRDALEPVTFTELRQLMRDGDVTVVDVRPAEEYRAGHIPGALSIPVPDLKRRLREIPRAKEVIAYCRGRYCVYSLEAVTLLRKQGYRARRAHEGLPDWRAAGLPLEGGQGA